MSVVKEYLANNLSYGARFRGPLPMPPSHQVAVVACMDARLNVYDALGLEEGAAHVIRNAGGVITDAEIRSLAISQHLLGTREIVLIHHTDCGMLTFTDETFLDRLENETGERPEWKPMAFSDAGADVLRSMQLIADNPFIAEKNFIRGFVFDVATGLLTEVLR